MLIQAQQTRVAFPEASVWKATQDRWTDVIKKTPTTTLYANDSKKENIQPQFRKQILADALSVSKGDILLNMCFKS